MSTHTKHWGRGISFGLMIWGLCALPALGAVPAQAGPGDDYPTHEDGGPDGLEPEILSKPPGARPNILLIMADDLGYGDLGCYGSDFILTPVLDQMAAQGMKLTNFATNSPGCTPSRVSILTGTMATYHGFVAVNKNDTHRGIPKALTTLGEVLRVAGYNTGHVGKWHIGEDLDQNTKEFLPPALGFDWSARLFIPTQQTHWSPLMVLNEQTNVPHPGEHSTPVLTDYALDFLDQQADADEPWFLNLWYFAPHLPMNVPASYLSLYPGEDPAAPWTKFAAMVSQMDEGIGQVFDKLDELGMTDDTLVMFISDNGGSLSTGLHPDGMGGLKGGKGDLFDGGIRVPCIVRWPAIVAAGSEDNAKVYASDILPTAQELVGSLKSIPNAEGRSMVPILRGLDPGPRTRNFYWTLKNSYTSPAPAHGILNAFSVRQDHTSLGGQDLKLVFSDQDTVELYNMDTDPTESTNLKDVLPGKTQKLWDWYWTERRAASERRYTPTMHGQAVDVDGSLVFVDGLAEIETDAWLDFHDGHFSAMFNARIQQVGVEQVLMRKADSWELILTEDDLIELTVFGDDGTSLVLSTSMSVSVGQSVNIAWTVVRWATPIKDNDVRLYVNGFLQATGEIPAVQPNRNPVQMGNDGVPPLGTRPLTGVISKVAFHNVALNKDELAGSWPAIPGP